MSQSLVVNGVTYTFPDVGESDWGQNVTDWAVAVTQNMLQRSGGSFTLGAEVDFGASFGLKSLYYKSRSSNLGSTGILRLANNGDAIVWRNAANSSDLALLVDASNQLTFNGSALAMGGTVLAGAAGRLGLYPGAGVTIDDAYMQNGFAIDVAIATQAARSAALTYTIPNPGNAVTAASFVLTEGAQTIAGAITLSATLTAAAINATAIAGTTLALSATTNQIVLGTTNTTTITSPAPAASRIYTIPDAGGAASFVMTEGTQTINGAKTFGSGITAPLGTFTNTTNQIVLGVTNTTTITSPAPAASRVYTIPDAGAAASFVMTEVAQTINGVKTFGSAPVLSALTASTVLVLDGSKNVASSAITGTQLGYLTNLFKYRRPALAWVSVTTVQLEQGLYDGVAGKAAVLFTDGELRFDSTASHVVFDITRNAVFNGSNQSGLRTSLSEATNTWYAIYAVKETNASGFVLVGDTTLPMVANYATLNSAFGTNSWVYLGLIRNGDQSGATGDILRFVQNGNKTIFYNTAANAGTNACVGIVMATASGAANLTYTYSAGTSGLVIPDNIGLGMWAGCVNVGSTGAVQITDSATAITYMQVTNQVSTNTHTFWGAVLLGVKAFGPASSNLAIFFQGFVDDALGVGTNPLV